MEIEPEIELVCDQMDKIVHSQVPEVDSLNKTHRYTIEDTTRLQSAKHFGKKYQKQTTR